MRDIRFFTILPNRFEFGIMIMLQIARKGTTRRTVRRDEPTILPHATRTYEISHSEHLVSF